MLVVDLSGTDLLSTIGLVLLVDHDVSHLFVSSNHSFVSEVLFDLDLELEALSTNVLESGNQRKRFTPMLISASDNLSEDHWVFEAS